VSSYPTVVLPALGSILRASHIAQKSHYVALLVTASKLHARGVWLLLSVVTREAKFVV
jgi:hypothetical protein